MTNSGDFWPPYGWTLAVIAAILVLGLLVWRNRSRQQRRDRQRVRRLARQRAWDWLMMRQNVRRLTYRPDEDRA